MERSTLVKIALVGGGPSALFVYKRLVESQRSDIEVEIFERSDRLGVGMPYGPAGAEPEHITNVSSSELPELPETLESWVKRLPEKKLQEHRIRLESFHEDRVIPRLLLGEYLQAQFQTLLETKVVKTNVHLNTRVIDIRELRDLGQMEVLVSTGTHRFDHAVICSGHNWPRPHEGKVDGYFDSPYPPRKLAIQANHPVALRGSSLTAIDAIRTLARSNGSFIQTEGGELVYRVAPESQEFRLVMHSRNGMLPCVRFHLEDPEVPDEGLLQRRDWLKTRESNEGFVPLDLFFEEDFKQELKDKDPALYDKVRTMSLEQFVTTALELREERDPFELFEAEYRESLESLRREESVHWKEALSTLSFALNYPAKHFSAEDSLRMSKILSPLISIVIAFLPHSSTLELQALHRSGRLSLLDVGDDSEVEVTQEGIEYRTRRGSTLYRTYVDCVGQPALGLEKFPFPSLVKENTVRPARLRFRDPEQGRRHQEKSPDQVQQDPDGSFHLLVPGLAINDNYQPLDAEDRANPRLSIMAVPYIGGHNPDYSGLDFCERASELIVAGILRSPEPAPYSGSAA